MKRITKEFIRSNPDGIWLKDLKRNLIFIPQAALEPLERAAINAAERQFSDYPFMVMSVTTVFNLKARDLYIHLDDLGCAVIPNELTGDSVDLTIQCHRMRTDFSVEAFFTLQKINFNFLYEHREFYLGTSFEFKNIPETN